MESFTIGLNRTKTISRLDSADFWTEPTFVECKNVNCMHTKEDKISCGNTTNVIDSIHRQRRKSRRS